MTSVLHDLSKLNNIAAKVVVAADSALPGLSRGDGELLTMNLERLRQTCEESEEVYLGNL